MINNNTIFDKFSKDYDAWYKTTMGSFVDKEESNALLSLLTKKPKAKVLDIGCGTGNFTYKLHKLDYQVTGIDISKEMLHIAEQKNTTYNIPFHLMNGESLAFDDHTFDAIISVTAFEFMPYPQAIYEEMKRVVKPDGQIIIGTIQQGGSWEQLYTSDICKGTAYESATFKTLEDIVNLDKNHFVEAKECLFLPPTLNEDQYTDTINKEYKSKNVKGGFICVKFQMNHSSHVK